MCRTQTDAVKDFVAATNPDIRERKAKAHLSSAVHTFRVDICLISS